ncbi:hypothetical protein [Rhodobacter amnigenus]|nr:hypothetical protein [Rhodobacter amnigenus]
MQRPLSPPPATQRALSLGTALPWGEGLVLLTVIGFLLIGV